MPRCPTSKSPGAFNAHNPGDGGSGLVQPVFRSPARIPAAESSRRGLCAAPTSEKRLRYQSQDRRGGQGGRSRTNLLSLNSKFININVVAHFILHGRVIG